MGKLYQIIHSFEEEGEFGDAVFREDVVATFSSEEKAKRFIREFSNPHIYDESCVSKFSCGELEISEIELDIVPPQEDMWWLHN